jgi:hypothetical protein
MARTRTTFSKANPPTNGFKPGQSGNPSGRPKNPSDVVELARAATPQAIAALIRKLDDPKDCIEAAVALLDRGWGRPPQSVLVNSSVLVSGIDKPPEITESYEEWLARRRSELDAIDSVARPSASAQQPALTLGSSPGIETVATGHPAIPAAEPLGTPGERPQARGGTPMQSMTAEQERWLEQQRQRLGLDDNTHPNPGWKG